MAPARQENGREIVVTTKRLYAFVAAVAAIATLTAVVHSAIFLPLLRAEIAVAIERHRDKGVHPGAARSQDLERIWSTLHQIQERASLIEREQASRLKADEELRLLLDAIHHELKQVASQQAAIRAVQDLIKERVESVQKKIGGPS